MSDTGMSGVIAEPVDSTPVMQKTRKSKRNGSSALPMPTTSTPRATVDDHDEEDAPNMSQIINDQKPQNGSEQNGDQWSGLALLNNRFARIMEENRNRQSEIDSLKNDRKVELDNKNNEVAAIKELYETELTEARRLLDEESNRAVKLQLKLKNAEEAKFAAEESQKTLSFSEKNARQHAEELQKDLDKLNGEVQTLRRVTNDAETQKASLNMQLSAAKDEAADFKAKYDAEVLNKVKRDNEMQSLKEDHLMQLRVWQKELNAAKAQGSSCYESRLSEQRAQHESDMTQALEDIRSEQERSRADEHEKLSLSYGARINALNAKLTETKEKLKAAQDDASKKRAINAQTNKQLEKSEKELARVRSEMGTALRQAQANLASQKGLAEAKIQDLESEITDAHTKNLEMSQTLEKGKSKYSDLLNEVTTYRTLLDMEENRLNITPSPNQRRKRQRPSASSNSLASTPKRSKTTEDVSTIGADDVVTDDGPENKSCSIM